MLLSFRYLKKTLYPPGRSNDYLKMDKSINQLVKENEVPNEYHKKLLQYCKEVDVEYLCTPTDEN